MAVDFAQAYDEDIHLIREADDEEGQALDAHFEILSIISKLGGNTRQYRRERAAQMNRILSEVYSAPQGNEGRRTPTKAWDQSRIRL